MHRNWTYRLILTSGLVASLAHAQQSCVNGIRVDGTITDPTGAVIPGAQVLTTDGDLSCVKQGLAPGEKVVVDGLDKLRPGSKVAPVDAEGQVPANNPKAKG